MTKEAFAHPALVYHGRAEYVAGTVPFLRAGLAAGEAVAAAVPVERLDWLRAALGGDAARVDLIDMSEAGRNPGRIIPGVLRSFVDAHGVRPVRIIGEPIWPGRTDVEYPACVQHEALINAAFRGRSVTILCPYDADGLDQRSIVDAERTHPIIIDALGERFSARFDPTLVVAEYNVPLADPPDGRPPDTDIAFDRETLPRARHVAIGAARRLGLAADRVADLALAVSEMTSNSVRHGGGRGTLRIWTAGRHLVCEVRDAGVISDPLAGRSPAPPKATRGRGLLLVNQVADLVRVHTGRAGTTIHVHMRLCST